MVGKPAYAIGLTDWDLASVTRIDSRFGICGTCQPAHSAAIDCIQAGMRAQTIVRTSCTQLRLFMTSVCVLPRYPSKYSCIEAQVCPCLSNVAKNINP